MSGELQQAHPVAEHTNLLTQISGRLDQHENEMDAFQARLQKSVEDWHTHRVDFARLQDAVTEITSTLGRIEGTLGEIKAQVRDTNGRVGKLEVLTGKHAVILVLAGSAIAPLWAIVIRQMFGGG